MNYSLDCWQCILTSSPVNAIEPEYWDNYLTMDSKSSSRPTLCIEGWEAILSQKSSTWLDYTSKGLLKAVDKLADDMSMTPDYFSATGTKQWIDLMEAYNNSLKDVFDLHIEPLSPDDVTYLKLKLLVPHKLEWLAHSHFGLHYAPILPLLTPKTLDCITQAFQQMPNALTEVCPRRRLIIISKD